MDLLETIRESRDLLEQALQVVSTYRSNTVKKSSISPAFGITVLLCADNPNRKGLTIYNNSISSLYIGVEADVSGGNQIAQLGTNAGVTAYLSWWGPCIYTGPIYVRRNAGAGAIIAYEFE